MTKRNDTQSTKKHVHAFGEIEFTSREGYSVKCQKCGYVVLLGFSLSNMTHQFIEAYKNTDPKK